MHSSVLKLNALAITGCSALAGHFNRIPSTERKFCHPAKRQTPLLSSHVSTALDADRVVHSL